MGRKVDSCRSIVLLLVEITFLSTVLFEGQMGDAAAFDLNHRKPNTNHVEWVPHDDCFQDVKVYEDPRPYYGYSNNTCTDIPGNYTREERTAAGNFQQTIMIQVVMLSSLISLALGIFVIDHVLASQESVEKTFKITSTAGGERKMRLLLSSTVSIILTMVLLQPHLISCVMGDASSTTDQNCTRKCGDVNVPYPFGLTDDIGEGCYRDNYSLTCNETGIYWGNFQVIDIKLESSQMRIFIVLSYKCYNTSERDTTMQSGSLSRNFKLSQKDNVYVGLGCDTYAYLYTSYSTSGEHDYYASNYTSDYYTSGCISICGNKKSVLENSCSGMGCCQASIPPNTRAYWTEFENDNNHTKVLDFNPCSYAFLVEKNNYTFDISDLTNMNKERRFPVVFDWSIGNQTCEEARKSPDYACVSKNSDCLDSTDGESYICNCSSGYRGNPYLQDGCQDIDECQYPDIYACNGTCTNILGSYNCSCPEGTTGDPKTYGCFPIPRLTKTQVKIPVTVALCSGLFFMLAIGGAILILKRIKRRRKVIQRKRYFLENHGLLLQHLLSSCDDSTTNTKIFTMKEMMKATNNFDDARIVGRGGHGVVYKGILSDLRVVAIKKSKIVVKSEIEEFINEVALLSQMNHKNIVKLFGCCLETEVPLLIYEFISNGTLADNLHVWEHDLFYLSWEERLRIASEVAGAIAYFHFSTSRSIFHRDLKSANILLDDKLTAKVSDFGASKFIMADQTHVTTIVQGTFGYLDPEYFQTGRLTDKSDVYSFGVILVELLTGEKPNSVSASREGRNLITHFLWMLNEKKLFQIIEPLLVNETTKKELQAASELAESCLKLKGEDRPTMKDVEVILNGLRKKSKRN